VGLRGRSVEFVFRIPRHIRNWMLWGVLFAGVLVLFFKALEFPQVDLAIVSIGFAFITAGGIGAYMMFATNEILEKLYADLAGISGKIDTISEKIDTMSDKLSGKIDDQRHTQGYQGRVGKTVKRPKAAEIAHRADRASLARRRFRVDLALRAMPEPAA